MIVSGFRAVLDLDTNSLTNLIRPQFAEWAKLGRGNPVLIMHIVFFACFHTISLERSRFSGSPDKLQLELAASVNCKRNGVALTPCAPSHLHPPLIRSIEQFPPDN